MKKNRSEGSFTELESFLSNTVGRYPKLSAARRERIWHKANAMSVSHSVQSRQLPAFLYPLFAFLLALAFLMGYASVVFASGASVPGEPLYEIERHAEAIWLTFTPKSQRTDVELTLLERRIYEVQALLNAGREVPPSLFQEVELLLAAVVELDGSDGERDVLPQITRYRDLLAELVVEHPGVWGLNRVFDAADAAVVALGGAPYSAPPIGEDPRTLSGTPFFVH